MNPQEEQDVIRFQAQVSRVSTGVDGGIRLTLELPNSAVAVATALLNVWKNNFLLEVAAVAVDPNKARFSDPLSNFDLNLGQPLEDVDPHTERNQDAVPSKE